MTQQGTPLQHLTARARMDEWRRRIALIEPLLTLNRAVELKDAEIAELTGLKPAEVASSRLLLLHVGAIHYESHRGHIAGSQWTLLKAGQDLQHALHLEMERQMRGGLSPETMRDKRKKANKIVTRRSAEQPAVIEDRWQEPVGALIGPEPTNVMLPLKGLGPDAAGALVLAAKQYKGGETDETRQARKILLELHDLGIPAPEELAQKAVAQKDDRLEAISLVLPYIDGLERRLKALEAQLKEQGDYGTLKTIALRQKAQIERLVTEAAARSMKEQGRGQN
jgi:hypothetical protein